MLEFARLLSQPDNLHRVDFLKLALQCVNGANALAAIWLLDNVQSELVLSELYTAQNRIGVSTFVKSLPYSDENNILTSEFSASLAEVFSDQSEQTRVIPLATTSGFLGFLQITHASLNPEAEEKLHYLAESLSAQIARKRKTRELIALGELAQTFAESLNARDALTQAAALIVKSVDAELCLIYRYDNVNALTVIAQSPTSSPILVSANKDSLVHRVAQGRILYRVPDLLDDVVRSRICGTILYDRESLLSVSKFTNSGRCQAWMACPIEIDTNISAVCVLYNKSHLHNSVLERFTLTDEVIFRSCCEYIGKTLPGAETYTALQLFLSLDFFKAIAELDPRLLQTLGNALAQILPTLSYAALILVGTSDTVSRTLNLIPNRQIDSAFQPAGSFSGRVVDNDGISHTLLHRSCGEAAHLCLAIRRDGLARHETMILHFFTDQLRRAIEAFNAREQEINKVVQMRHAVKSGLFGARGHLQSVLNEYDKFVRRSGSSGKAVARIRTLLHRTHTQLERAVNLVNESKFLLNQISPQTIKRTPVNIRQLIAEASLALRSDADRRNISIGNPGNDLKKTSVTFSGDNTLLFMVFFNLLENAVKYSHRNSKIVIDLSLASTLGGWEVSIENVGIYIQPEDLLIIFEPYERRPSGSAASTRAGSGLGLAVAKQIIHSHGGSIVATSVLDPDSSATDPRACTRFTIRVPKTRPT